MKTIGSQKRETLQEAGFELVEKSDNQVILKEIETLNLELWVKNDDYAGYVVEIDGIGYEFAVSLS